MKSSRTLCSKDDINVVRLILEHARAAALLRCFNAHMPSKAATPLRKEVFAKKMCRLATDPPILQQARSSVDAHRAAGMPWIIAGDINADLGAMDRWCARFVNGRTLFFSRSEWPVRNSAQQADWAVSQGIAVDACRSWVGFRSQPCVSDVHDAVVVRGVTKAIESKDTLARCLWIPCFRVPRRCLWIPWRCLGIPWRCLAQLLLCSRTKSREPMDMAD